MVEMIVQHGLVPVGHLPASGGALADHLNHGAAIQPRFFRKMQRFGKPLDQPGDGNLVAHLGHLSRARLANPAAELGIGFHHRQGGVEGVLITAAHDRKLPVLGPRLTTRNRRIDEIQARVLGGGIHLFGDLGRYGGVIDKDRALGHAAKGPVVAHTNAAQVIVIADASHHDFCSLGGFARGGGHAPAVVFHPSLGLGPCPVIDTDVMPRRLQVPRHRIAHHAKAKECQFRHCLSPFHCLAPDF